MCLFILLGKHWFLYSTVFLKNMRVFSELTLQTRIIGDLLERFLMSRVGPAAPSEGQPGKIQ